MLIFLHTIKGFFKILGGQGSGFALAANLKLCFLQWDDNGDYNDSKSKNMRTKKIIKT